MPLQNLFIRSLNPQDWKQRQDRFVLSVHMCIHHFEHDLDTFVIYFLNDVSKSKFLRPQRLSKDLSLSLSLYTLSECQSLMVRTWNSYLAELIRSSNTLRSRQLNNRLSRAEKKASFDVMSPAYASGSFETYYYHSNV